MCGVLQIMNTATIVFVVIVALYALYTFTTTRHKLKTFVGDQREVFIEMSKLVRTDQSQIRNANHVLNRIGYGMDHVLSTDVATVFIPLDLTGVMVMVIPDSYDAVAHYVTKLSSEDAVKQVEMYYTATAAYPQLKVTLIGGKTVSRMHTQLLGDPKLEDVLYVTDNANKLDKLLCQFNHAEWCG